MLTHSYTAKIKIVILKFTLILELIFQTNLLAPMKPIIVVIETEMKQFPYSGLIYISSRNNLCD